MLKWTATIQQLLLCILIRYQEHLQKTTPAILQTMYIRHAIQWRQSTYLEEQEIRKLGEDDCCKTNRSGYDSVKYEHLYVNSWRQLLQKKSICPIEQEESIVLKAYNKYHCESLQLTIILLAWGTAEF